jgi:hypothetical protein
MNRRTAPAARRHRGMLVAPPARPIEPLAPYVDRSEWQAPVNARFWVLLWLGMLALTALGVALTIGWRP